MAAASGPGRPVVLGQNQYGKAEVRVVKIDRADGTHHIKDLNVSVALSGDLDEAHYSGSNAHVLPTDTTKNTVFAFAKEHGVSSAEQFAVHLARHFVGSVRPVARARIRVEEYGWERIAAPGHSGTDEPRHSFVRGGRETRTAQVTFDGEEFEVLSGLTGLTVLNSTGSEFRGYLRDRYTTLEEDDDRILATEITAAWRHSWSGGAGDGGAGDRGMPGREDWDALYAETRRHLLEAFAGTYSRSLQETLYRMGERVIDSRAELDEIRFAMPNRHHFRVDLEPFGLTNEAADGAVYHVADRPYGLIEATVLRAGSEARIPPGLTSP